MFAISKNGNPLTLFIGIITAVRKRHIYLVLIFLIPPMVVWSQSKLLLFTSMVGASIFGLLMDVSYYNIEPKMIVEIVI